MRHWKNAATFGDLCDLMARWLEGDIRRSPTFLGRRPEAETTPLIPTLAAINRARFLTEDSQPGTFERHGRQRAAVSGFVADRTLLRTLTDQARRAGLTIVVDGKPGPVVVTEDGGRPFTWYGRQVPDADLNYLWDAVGSDARRSLIAARQVAVIDPQWGPSDRLWTVLDQIARRYR